MLSLLSALIAAPLLVVVAPAESPLVDVARGAGNGVVVVEGFSTVPGPVCAQNPACVVGGVNRGDAVMWTRPAAGGDGVVVIVARRPDGAVVVEERVVDVAGVDAAVGRVVGQVPAGLERLATTSPVAAPSSSSADGAPAGDAPPVVAVAEEEGSPVIWWVVGGVAVAAVLAGVVVGSLVLADAQQNGGGDDACGTCVNGACGNCFICTGISDSIDSACTAACGGIGAGIGDGCSDIGSSFSGSCDGLTGACDGLSSIGSCATLPGASSLSSSSAPAPVPLPPVLMAAPPAAAVDGDMAW